MNLLINEQPLQVLPSLAKAITLNNAILLQQVHYWLQKSNDIQDGQRWVYKTVEEWNLDFPFWSRSTLERIIKNLEERELLIVANYNESKMDRTKWYRINYGKLNELSSCAIRHFDVMQSSKIRKAQ